MRCPACKQAELQPSSLDATLLANHCPHCGGNWITLGDYLRWRDLHPQAAGSTATLEPVEADESRKALLCPISGVLMQKYRISHRHNHRIDLSPAVGAFWLDKGEWELLKQEGLSGVISAIFTDPYQRQVREASAHDTFTAHYTEQFGAENYAKLREVRAWLDGQAHRDALLAYLMAKDPYSANR